jgi:hypothetical protein
MLKSWLLLLASDAGQGTPPSGAAAQVAVWPGETADVRPAVQDKKDQALKVRGIHSISKTASPYDDSSSYNKAFKADWTGAAPAYQPVDSWRSEIGEQCMF